MVGTVITAPISQTRKRRLRGVKISVKDPSASKWLSGDLNPGGGCRAYAGEHSTKGRTASLLELTGPTAVPEEKFDHPHGER